MTMASNPKILRSRPLPVAAACAVSLVTLVGCGSSAPAANSGGSANATAAFP